VLASWPSMTANELGIKVNVGICDTSGRLVAFIGGQMACPTVTG